MKYSIYAALVSLSLISCGSNDNMIEDPRPIDQTIHNFEFRGYAVQSTTLYKGSSGQKSNPDESYLGNYWSSYQQPMWKSISLDLKNNSIKLISGNSSTDLSYSIKIVNDSVLINGEGNKPNYLGSFHKETSTFALKRTFRYTKKEPRDDGGMVIAQNTLFGTTQYEEMFGIAFKSPSEMTKIGDVILWSNVEYYYR